MKILVIFTGGTIGSSWTDSQISPDTANSYFLLKSYSNESKVVFETDQPFSILSENMDAEHLIKLYNCIKSHNIQSYDGIIVTHGTDTLQYTSSFLSYAFGLCSVPIVLVSANYPLTDNRTNGHINFSSAVDFITSKSGKGVFVAYQNNGEAAKIHRGSRLLPHLPYSDNIYSTLNSFYGEIVNHNFVANPNYSEQPDDADFVTNTNLSKYSNVLFIQPYVGCSYPQVSQNTKAVLLATYHSGTVNTSDSDFARFCLTAKNMNVPVFLTGDIAGFEYASKADFEKFNIRVLPPCSPIAMYIKLWLLPKNKINSVFIPFGGDMEQ